MEKLQIAKWIGCDDPQITRANLPIQVVNDKGRYHSRSGRRERDGRDCGDGCFRLPGVATFSTS